MPVRQGNNLFFSMFCEGLRPIKDFQKLLRNILFSKCFSLFVLPFFSYFDMFFFYILLSLRFFCCSFLLALPTSFDIMHVEIIIIFFNLRHPFTKVLHFLFESFHFSCIFTSVCFIRLRFYFPFSFCHYFIFSFSFF